MGSKSGAVKAAASRLGMSLDEYTARLNAGEKWCTKCKRWKQRSQFNRDNSRGDGLKSKCRDCCYSPKTSKPGQHKRRRMLKQNLKWCRGCSEWLPKEKVNRQGLCRKHYNEQQRQHYAENETHRSKVKQRTKIRKKTVEPVPIIAREILAEDFEGKCAYCGKFAAAFDHIVPVNKGGTTAPYNIVPCCKSCNSSKRDKDVFEWLESKELPISQELLDRLALIFL